MGNSSIEPEFQTAVTTRGLLDALRLALPLIAGLVALAAVPHLISRRLGLDFDALFWICGGVTFAGLTLSRPWWFWNHYHAIAARVLLTERGTIVAYLCVALFAVVAGTRRQFMISVARKDCIVAVSHAKDSHERFQILRQTADSELPHSGSARESISCELLLEAP
jgi:hypothetical protein